MPTDLEGVHLFKEVRILSAPGQAANAGGVALSGLEMSQNQARLSWTEDQLQEQLRELMRGIHDRCVAHGGVPGETHYVDNLPGANIAGFV